MELSSRALRRIALAVAMAFALAATAQAQQPPPVTRTDDGLSRIELATGFVFTWKIVDEHIEATVSAPTTGWVAIGFNPVNRMQGATYVIGYVQGSDVAIRHDWGTSPTSHRDVVAAGGVSRVTALGGKEEGGRTEISFRLPLDPGDRFFSPIRPGAVNTVIWAFGPNGADNFTSIHRQLGSFAVTF